MTGTARDRARLATALTAVLLLVAPTGLAYHLSAGAEDTVGLSQNEPPADTDEDLYDRGTRTDCRSGLEADPSNLTADGFCGELVYNEDTSYETASPRDQVRNPATSLAIDLQKATYVGLYGIATCSPWCNSPETYHAVNDAGAELGLTPTGDEVDDGGTQVYGGNVYAAGPSQAYAEVGQTWLIPATDTSFVAFVTDADGEPVGDEDLASAVEAAKEAGDLDSRARSQVCAFTPEAHLGTHAPDAGRCEVALDWIGDDDGQDPCEAETYVCGTVGPTWRGTTMCPMWHAACYLSDAWNSAHHFAVWHGLVAPSPPSGCAAAEPGFDTDPTAFLAHDLDVHTPPSDEMPAKGVPLAWDEASRNVPGLGPLRDGRAPAVAQTPTGEQVKATPAFAQHEREPNTDGWRGIPEDSQERSEERSLTECRTLATGETDADPWVNIVDAHVTRQAGGFGVPAGSSPEPDHEPRPSMRVTGEVGLFADVDDDGRYEQAPASEVFSFREHGAYPILWDHHAAGEGCSFRSGTTIGDLTTEAGYADPTGLAVTLRLTAGTLVDTRTGDTRVLAEPTAVVLLSERLDADDAAVKDVIAQAAGDREPLVLEDAFQPQCGEPTGGFTSAWEIQAPSLEGDGMAAAAIVTVDDTGLGGEAAAVPASPIDLGSGTHVWWDVDPFASTLAN